MVAQIISSVSCPFFPQARLSYFIPVPKWPEKRSERAFPRGVWRVTLRKATWLGKGRLYSASDDMYCFPLYVDVLCVVLFWEQ